MTLAESMLLYRAEHNLSQRALAEMCGVTKQTIYSIENGLQNPSKLTEAKIRLVLSNERGNEK